MKPDLRLMLERQAAAERTTRAHIMERALRAELGAPLAGLVREFVNPRQAKELHDTAARLGHEPHEVLEALIRTCLPSLTEHDIDPELRARRAKERARELLA